MEIRPTNVADIPALQLVLDATGLFPSELLPDMMSSFLTDEESQDLWLSCDESGTAIGFCYATPEELTEGTWNMLAIAVHPSKQGCGHGGAIVKYLETTLQKNGYRVLIAGTSGKEEFLETREFYKKNGYAEEARIRDFWAAGDDKIVFWKRIG